LELILDNTGERLIPSPVDDEDRVARPRPS
jgi:hypothetical protein